MGAIKTQELANGNIGLEITYGGLEAPFGGIDSSMPPAYIDPKCQTEIDGFVIVENQLIAAALQLIDVQITVPDSGFTTPRLGGFGSFYTKADGYQNFVYLVGDSTTAGGIATTNVALYVWPSSNAATPTPIVLTFTQPVIIQPATPATVDVLTAVLSGAATGDVTVTIANHSATEVYGPYSASLSQSAMAAQLAADIAALPSVIVTASVDASTTSVTLTTTNTGSIMNNTTVAFANTVTGGTYMYSNTNFQGGMDAYNYPAAVAPYPLSFVSEGEVLCLGGPGTVIFQYNNEIFSILSQYVGANVLRKFGGSLIALGITPSPGTQIQSPEMVMAWSAANTIGVWNPTDSNGNVTGAGFEQLDDIEDILTGGFVNSSTLIILRSKGASYATLTGNGTEPFSVSHVDLAPEGEGCQGQLLSSQYGPVGFYVGNSNVFEFVQSAKGIGDKIKSMLYAELSPQSPAIGDQLVLAASKAVNSFILANEVVFYSISAGPYVFFYNANNGTWTRMLGQLNNLIEDIYMEDFLIVDTNIPQNQKQSQLILGIGIPSTKTFSFFALKEQVPNGASYNDNQCLVTFPQEEISFGRDITIDGLYVSMAGTTGQVITFSVRDSQSGNVVFTSTFTFPIGSSYGTLQSYQIFDSTGGNGTSTGTAKAPQLTVEATVDTLSIKQFRIAKVAMFGSFDPKQRPV